MGKIILVSFILFCCSVDPIYTYDVHIVQKKQMEVDVIDHAIKAFETLLVGAETKNELIPSQTKILGVQWNGSTLILDVSKEISSYGGGTAIEYEIMCQLLNTAFSIPEVEQFTLLIEGEEKYLPEGTQIMNYTRDRYMRNVQRY